MATIAEINQLISLIRNESRKEGNTKERVADAFERLRDLDIWLKKGGYEGTAKDIKKLIDKIEKDKVDKEPGKGLSANDFTNELKEKLAGIEKRAQKNVQADWNETNARSDAYIKNKPEIPEGVDVSNKVDKDGSNINDESRQALRKRLGISDLVDTVTGNNF